MLQLGGEKEIFVRQKFELAELFGYESRNKYVITRADHSLIAYVAEQGKGLLAMFGRQFRGHWRSFELHFFGVDRQVMYHAKHPFRFFFQRLELYDANGRFIGAAQKRFAFLYKRFDVEGADGRLLLQMSSPPWKPWTFPFQKSGRDAAIVKKKWVGLLAEAFTDKDTFQIQYPDPTLANDERLLVLMSGIFIDLIYFEVKATQNEV
ncbi:MAG: hypothetical protein H7249_20785 [Chitinophagaceae bacterium]|nr:hypothetical protein [Oligoflexus sp.]